MKAFAAAEPHNYPLEQQCVEWFSLTGDFGADIRAGQVELGRIAALYHRSSTFYQNRQETRYTSLSDATM
jgi:hypothetical protein